MTQPSVAHDAGARRGSRPSALALVAIGALALLALAAGQLTAQAMIPEPVIALVDIYGPIDPAFRANYQARFDYINSHPEVAGVVLLIDSPGGEASASEELYYDIARLRERIPVVASITRLGASGAYYAAMGANYVMTKPGANVGSIGVISSVVSPTELTTTELTSGPFKASGYSPVQFARGLEMVKEHFAGVVYAERLIAWDRWHADAGPFPQTQDSLSTGRVWAGAAALDAGVVDGFGSTEDAIEQAAALAGLRRYRVQYLDYNFMTEQGYTIAFEDDTLPTIDEILARIDEWPGYWYIFVPPVE